jgi:hypothetical protein
MKALLLSSIMASSLLLGGCVISIGDDEGGYSYGSSWEKREAKNRNYISELDLGVSKERIIDTLGAADFIELTTSNGEKVQVLYYRTQRIHDDSMTTKDECTPLVFINGELVGFGDSVVQKYI